MAGVGDASNRLYAHLQQQHVLAISLDNWCKLHVLDRPPLNVYCTCCRCVCCAGTDGMVVPVRVRSTGTVAEVITSAVESLRCQAGTTVSYK
jgi:hypothetical protein